MPVTGSLGIVENLAARLARRHLAPTPVLAGPARTPVNIVATVMFGGSAVAFSACCPIVDI
jgi:hypothetical protein